MSVSISPPEEVVKYLYDTTHPVHNLKAVEHRQQLIRRWGILPGSRVLEIGPGQGDFTVALADAVGPAGRVVAIDNAPPLYGTPPLEEAQAFVLASPVGKRIKFIRGDPLEVLGSSAAEKSSPGFEFMVFCHSIWYFNSPDDLPRLLRLANSCVGSVLIAEYSMSTRLLAAFPHVLAALVNNTLESLGSEHSLRNIRSAQTPAQITRTAEDAGWVVQTQETLTPAPGQQDGLREVNMVLNSPYFRADLAALSVNEQVRTMLGSMVEAVSASVAQLEGGIKAVRNMDVWVARFSPST